MTERQRPVRDVLRDVTGLLAPYVSGAGTPQDVALAWAVIDTARRLFEESESVLHRSIGTDDVPDWKKWSEIGQQYACAKVIRTVADSLGISSYEEVNRDG